MSNHKRRLLSALMAIVVGSSLSTLTPQPGHAHPPTCYRSTCNGQDPADKGCDHDARNLESFRYQGSFDTLQGVLLELRWSPACDAAWVRTTDGYCFDVWIPCYSVLQVQGGQEQIGSINTGHHWTNMWSFRSYVRGCFMTGYPDTRTDGCTAWR
jgi:hypothetical protein